MFSTTIKETIELVNNDGENSFPTHFGNFTDYFYKSNKKKKYLAIKEEPNIYGNVPLYRYAIIASAVHKWCLDYKLRVPKWVFNDIYFLKEPYFAMDAKGDLRIYLLAESPIEFKIRNVFLTENCLTRV